MSKRKIVRLAVVRTNNIDPCPFGLNIPFGCQNAGKLVQNMAPLNIMGEDSTNEEKAEIAVANNHLLKWKGGEGRCIYADQIFNNDSKDSTNCNWNSNTAGTQQGGILSASPFFYRHFNGVGLDGVFTYPLGYYADNSIDRGMYYGMYSIESTGEPKLEITKTSEQDVTIDDYESTNKKQ